MDESAGSRPVPNPSTVTAVAAAPDTADPPAGEDAAEESDVRVLPLGDSTPAAVEEYRQTDGLWGFAATVDAASCRTLATPSCGSNPSLNVAQTLQARGANHSVAVVMTGYDECWETVALSIEGVEIAARNNGIDQWIWLTWRESVSYRDPNGLDLADSYRRSNELLRSAAARDGSIIVLADWNAYSTQRRDWYERDGIHPSPTGALAVADYISQVVSFHAGLPCIMHSSAQDAPLPCSDPDASGSERDLDRLYAS